jgi:hypothetical protein
MLAMKKFNKVRTNLSLAGPVSTALVTKFLMARDFDIDDAISLYKNYLVNIYLSDNVLSLQYQKANIFNNIVQHAPSYRRSQ